MVTVVAQAYLLYECVKVKCYEEHYSRFVVASQLWCCSKSVNNICVTTFGAFFIFVPYNCNY